MFRPEDIIQLPKLDFTRYQNVSDDSSVTWLEKADNSRAGKVSLEDIKDALDEFVKLFKVGLASKAEIATLARAFPGSPEYTEAASKQSSEDDSDPIVIGGPASVELVDREGHLITTGALDRAFKNFMKNIRTRNAMVLHSDVQVGWALPAYISKGGQIFKSGVDDKGLFFICELRDDTAIAKKVADQINKGMLKSYSIAGSATAVTNMKKGLTPYMQVDDMELAEVTVCEKGVNQGASFELLKAELPQTGKIDKDQCGYRDATGPEEKMGINCGHCKYFNADTRTCDVVVGDIMPGDYCRLFAACEEAEKPQTTRARIVIMHSKDDGTIDFTKSFMNWMQKEKDPLATGESFATLNNEAGRRAEHEQLLREYGFPSEQSFETMRYVPVVETETDDDGIPIHNLPPWVVNEAGEALGDRLDEDSPGYSSSAKAKARQKAGSAQKMFLDILTKAAYPDVEKRSKGRGSRPKRLLDRAAGGYIEPDAGKDAGAERRATPIGDPTKIKLPTEEAPEELDKGAKRTGGGGGKGDRPWDRPRPYGNPSPDTPKPVDKGIGDWWGGGPDATDSARRRSPQQRMKRMFQGAGRAAGQAGERGREMAGRAAGQAREAAGEVGRGMREVGRDVGERVGPMAQRAREEAVKRGGQAARGARAAGQEIAQQGREAYQGARGGSKGVRYQGGKRGGGWRGIGYRMGRGGREGVSGFREGVESFDPKKDRFTESKYSRINPKTRSTSAARRIGRMFGRGARRGAQAGAGFGRGLADQGEGQGTFGRGGARAGQGVRRGIREGARGVAGGMRGARGFGRGMLPGQFGRDEREAAGTDPSGMGRGGQAAGEAARRALGFGARGVGAGGMAAGRGAGAAGRFIGEYAPKVGAQARREGAARQEAQGRIDNAHADMGIGEGRVFSHPKFHGGNHADNRQKVIESMSMRRPKTVGEHLGNMQHLLNHNETGEKLMHMNINLPPGVNHDTVMDNHNFVNMMHPDSGHASYAGAGKYAGHPELGDHLNHIMEHYRDPSNIPPAAGGQQADLGSKPINAPQPGQQPITPPTGGGQPSPAAEAGMPPAGGFGPTPVTKPGYLDPKTPDPMHLSMNKILNKAFGVKSLRYSKDWGIRNRAYR